MQHKTPADIADTSNDDLRGHQGGTENDLPSEVVPNERAIKALKPAPAERRIYVPIKGSRVTVLVTENGPQSYCLRYKLNGQSQRKNLGRVGVVSLAQVLQTAIRDLSLIEVERRDLVAERQDAKASGTFGQLFDRWLAEHAKPNKRRWADDEYRYNTLVKPYLASEPVMQVDKATIITALDKCAREKTPTQARFARNLISAAMNWGGDRDLSPYFPRGIKSKKQKPRLKPWSIADIGRFWLELDKMGDAPTALALKLAVLTAKRISEICGAEQALLQLTGDVPVWTLRGNTLKPSRVQEWASDDHVPLTPELVALFKRAVSAAGRHDYVFPPRADAEKYLHIDPEAVGRQRTRINKALGIEDRTTHDLRTTISTHGVGLGIDGETRKALLNHKPQASDVTGTFYTAPEAFMPLKRVALEKWNAAVMASVEAAKKEAAAKSPA